MLRKLAALRDRLSAATRSTLVTPQISHRWGWTVGKGIRSVQRLERAEDRPRGCKEVVKRRSKETPERPEDVKTNEARGCAWRGSQIRSQSARASWTQTRGVQRARV
jgi:hypothetical protein